MTSCDRIETPGSTGNRPPTSRPLPRTEGRQAWKANRRVCHFFYSLVTCSTIVTNNFSLIYLLHWLIITLTFIRFLLLFYTTLTFTNFTQIKEIILIFENSFLVFFLLLFPLSRSLFRFVVHPF